MPALVAIEFMYCYEKYVSKKRHVAIEQRKSAATNGAGGVRMAPGRGLGHLCWWPLIQFISRRH
jgi:hypothetical protein